MRMAGFRPCCIWNLRAGCFNLNQWATHLQLVGARCVVVDGEFGDCGIRSPELCDFCTPNNTASARYDN